MLKIIPTNRIFVNSNPISIDNRIIDNLEKIKKFIKKRYLIIGCGALTHQKNFELLKGPFIYSIKIIKIVFDNYW